MIAAAPIIPNLWSPICSAPNPKGAKGVKFFGARPDVLLAAIDECREQGIGSAMHHAQMDVARADVLDTARAGLTTMEHWYGLPEALFHDRTVQHYPVDYNYADEQHRFTEAGRLWAQAAGPEDPRWQAVRDELIDLGFVLNPTMTIYEANRGGGCGATAVQNRIWAFNGETEGA